MLNFEKFGTAVDEGRSRFGFLRLTPKLSEGMLRLNTENFRPPSGQVVHKYGLSIEEKKFVLNPAAPIVIVREVNPETGAIRYYVLDGQQRMMAVVKTGQAVDVYLHVVPSDIGEPAKAVIDGGAVRMFKHYMAHRGAPEPNTCAALARLIYVHHAYAGKKSRSTRGMENLEGWNWFRRYQKGILFAATLCSEGRPVSKNSHGVNVAFRTALAKAYYCYPTERLQSFVDQFFSHNFKNPKTDHAVKLLFDYYVDNLRARGGGETPTHEYYLRCEWAIAAFAEKQKVDTLQAAEYAGQYFRKIPKAKD